MPYNTRRKSLSLPSLGIHLPQSSRTNNTPPSSAKSEQPPQKKAKRDHSPTFSAAHQPGRYEPTPPPSPPPENPVNYAEIDDDIVSGVVGILERTGNRPHTVKELAISLAPIVNLVENSANPNAIISSRLNAYLRRGFIPSPCLLKKELITTHPRRIYFYLTTCPHQEIPEHETPIGRRSVVSPALSDEEEEEMRRQSEMSPSPEVDLSSHELDDGESTVSDDTSFSSTTASMIARQRTRSPSSLGQKNALSSPRLEGDEREFSQSAIFIERRSASRETESNEQETPNEQAGEEFESDMTNDERSYEEAAALLGYPAVTGVVTLSSPTLAPTTLDRDVKREDLDKAPEKIHHVSGLGKAELYSWGGELERHLGSPESVELDELDGLLDF